MCWSWLFHSNSIFQLINSEKETFFTNETSLFVFPFSRDVLIIWSCSDIYPVVHIEIDQTIIHEISSVFKSSSSPNYLIRHPDTHALATQRREREKNLIKQSEWATFRHSSLSLSDLYQHETKKAQMNICLPSKNICKREILEKI